MNIAITFRHMVGTDAVKQYAHDKIAKLQRFLRQAMNAQVTLSVEGLEHIADVRISSGSQQFHATVRSQDMYASIDKVIDKLDRQIEADKTASMAKKRGGTSAAEFAAEAHEAAEGRARD
ncbi:ribosome hibernation-promoting factor, HPF/YfiA family [Polyangium jinanense]|uniref:Ribosome hibernation promoting factor n=1 Tax=Polyangium jinanense TaxID=2829994 RepID=A0A9X3XC84_9BACT|nr:ribosome-associated translation inhibitor RaiA [Polyangium jinanense]MDC3960410.1 ribosome-associated translation inhibitor RaiA [Polyangium jinanense]MDC3985346.1 ribosome-associated translation inhibitor RaiA [Polyangium jinanense]